MNSAARRSAATSSASSLRTPSSEALRLTDDFARDAAPWVVTDSPALVASFLAVSEIFSRSSRSGATCSTKPRGSFASSSNEYSFCTCGRLFSSTPRLLSSRRMDIRLGAVVLLKLIMAARFAARSASACAASVPPRIRLDSSTSSSGEMDSVASTTLLACMVSASSLRALLWSRQSEWNLCQVYAWKSLLSVSQKIRLSLS
mmetsp:Transcript_19283/g.72875  ORF Transcript_19283/g.72875 Transcript_19283/m.72875 type:complete len:202 (+) Transcript_19283:746-1351(+)